MQNINIGGHCWCCCCCCCCLYCYSCRCRDGPFHVGSVKFKLYFYVNTKHTHTCSNTQVARLEWLLEGRRERDRKPTTWNFLVGQTFLPNLDLTFFTSESRRVFVCVCSGVVFQQQSILCWFSALEIQPVQTASQRRMAVIDNFTWKGAADKRERSMALFFFVSIFTFWLSESLLNESLVTNSFS